MKLIFFFIIIRLPPELLPVLDRWNGDVTPTLDAALLCSFRAGRIWVVSPDWFEELIAILKHIRRA